MRQAEIKLKKFQADNGVFTKGPLSVVIQLSDRMKSKVFPLNPDDFKTEGRGQVLGLGGSNLRKILSRHGIKQQLSAEGGRTSRGSLGLMYNYVEFLNRWNLIEQIDFEIIEKFWANEIRQYFRNRPFVLAADTAKTIGANLNDLFKQAKKRQKQASGTQYLGSVIQHLVAAKLSLLMPDYPLEFHGASVADAPTDRLGDFIINDTVIHCTTMPSQLLIEKCKANISSGYHPVVITVFERVQTVFSLAEDANIDGRIEVWDIQQFLSSNIQEHSSFDENLRNKTLARIISKYNDIVKENETDPSLRIDFDSL